MKKGNLVSLSLVVVFLAGAIVCDVLLAAEYRKTDLGDPYKNFETVPLNSFRALSITGGNGYAIQLRQGPASDIKLLHSRKSFFQLQYVHDTAVLSFKVANQTFQDPKDCVTGLIITVPMFPVCQIEGVNLSVTGFQGKTMYLEAGKKAQVRLSDLQTRLLDIGASAGASIDFTKNNHADTLSLRLRTHASVTLNQVVFSKLERSVADSASLRFFGEAFDQLVKTMAPAAPAAIPGR